MKKSLFKIISVLFISTMIFVSCSNLFDSEKSVDGGYQISGTVSPYDFAETLPARTAFPTAPDSTTIFYYTVTATLGGKTVIDDVEGINGAQFNLKIPSAGEWSVTASCYDDESRQNLLYKTTTPTVIKVSNDSPSKFANLTLKPLMTSGKTGTLNLEIDGTRLASSFHPSQIQVECISGNLPDMDDRITYFFNILTKKYTLKTKDGKALPSGSYTFNINFITPSQNLYFYSVTETVNIYDGLETNRWVKNGNEEYVTSDGKFELTDEIVNKFQQESIYVDSSATSDNVSGSWIDPYKSLDAAIARLKANSSIKTIFVSGNHTISKNLNFSNGGNVTHDLTIKKNPRATAKPVVTTTTKESFIVGGPCKIVIENIDFAGCGNNDGASPTGTNSDTNTKAGAFLYFQASTGSAEITNCTISNYYSDKGGAICAGASSTTTLTNVNITGCKAKNGGAIAVHGNMTYVSGSIKECSATQNGGAICIFNNSKVSLTDITIADCITGNNDSAAIDIDGEATKAELKISGKNIIAENYLSGTTTKKNVRLESAARRIIIAGDIAGSKIGVSSANAPTMGHNLVFTSGYSTYNSGVAPSKYFIGDNFTVVSDNGEAALAVGGGLISKEIYDDVKFEIDRTSVFYDLPDASWRTINVKAKLADEEITLSSIKLKLLNRGDFVKESGTGTIVVDRDFLFDDTYVLQVEGVYKGTTYRGNFDISYTKGDNFLTLTAPPTSGSYNIASVDSMEKLGTMVNNGATFAGVELYLQEDIVLPENFVMIGDSGESVSNNFKGVFDGNNHKITVTGLAAGSTSIFGLVRESGVIRNLIVEGNVSATGDFYGLCNYLNVSARIENCINRCSITTTNGKAAGFSGGGDNGAVFVNCRNEADISGKNYVGGLVADCTNAKFDGCVNTGNITTTGDAAGGIAGKLYGSIVNCINTGTITARINAGGICGDSNTTSSNKDGIVNCYNSGSVIATVCYAGGILGKAGSTSTSYDYALVRNCFNTGSVTAETQNTAFGIIGEVVSGIKKIPSHGYFNNNYYLSGCVPEGQTGCAEIADSSGKFSASANIDDAITNLTSWVTSNPTFSCSCSGNFTLKHWRSVDDVIEFVE